MIEAKYRGARPADKAAVLGLLKEMHDEVGMFNMSETKVANKIDTVIQNGVCFVATVGEEIVGTLGLEPGDMWYSDDGFLSERWTFVKKKFRRSTIGKDLLRLADEYGHWSNQPVVAGVFSPNQVARKNALFRRFFHPVGERFIGGDQDVLRR